MKLYMLVILLRTAKIISNCPTSVTSAILMTICVEGEEKTQYTLFTMYAYIYTRSAQCVYKNTYSAKTRKVLYPTRDVIYLSLDIQWPDISGLYIYKIIN